MSSIEVPVDAIPDETVRGVCHEVNSLYFPKTYFTTSLFSLVPVKMCVFYYILHQECGICSSNKALVVKGIGLHYCILRCKAELDQLMNGLETFAVLNAIQTFYHLIMRLKSATINVETYITPIMRPQCLLCP